jgi:phosphoserine phosphatase RsbU/P
MGKGSSLLKKLKLSNQSVFDSIPHPLIALDITGEIIMKNKSWEFFCKANGGTFERCVIGSNYLSVFTQEIREGISRVLNGKLEQFIIEYPCGTQKVQQWLLMTVNPLFSELDNDKLEGVVISHINITDRKTLEIKQQKNLRFAKTIQKNVLEPPIINKSICIEAVYLPSHVLSGDMYAWYKINDNEYGVILLDIMGHGLASSLIGMSIHSLLKGIIKRVSHPIKVYEEINKHFYSLFRSHSNETLFFCTGIYLLINVTEKKISYFNAGNPRGILISDKRTQLLNSNVIPIGLSEKVNVKCQVIDFTENDQLFLHTDGFTDSMRLNLEETTEFFLTEGKSKLKNLTEENIISLIDKHVDDITIVSIKF